MSDDNIDDTIKVKRPRGRPFGSKSKNFKTRTQQRKILRLLSHDAARDCSRPIEFLTNIMRGLPISHICINGDEKNAEALEYPGLNLRARVAIALLNHEKNTGNTIINAEYADMATKLRDSFIERVTSVD